MQVLELTDVVALLKSVGASPKLTMQITGESLMNDGTAIVLYSLFVQMYRGIFKSTGLIVRFFFRMAFAGPALGLAFGLCGYWWISKATRKYQHSDITIQTSVTVCVAYLSFFTAEGVCNSSGVLCTVTAALVLAISG